MKCERSTADGVPDVGRAAGPRVEECGAVQGVSPWAAGTLTPAPRNTSAARRRRTAKIRRRSGDRGPGAISGRHTRSEEHTSELQSRGHLVCRLLLEKKNKKD